MEIIPYFLRLIFMYELKCSICCRVTAISWTDTDKKFGQENLPSNSHGIFLVIKYTSHISLQLNFFVTFTDPYAISQDIREPDILSFKILKSEFFIDAETGI